MLNVTCNKLFSVIYVTAHRCSGGLKKKFGIQSGSQRHGHFVGFFNVPVQAPIRNQPFYTFIPRNRPLIAFYDTMGIRRTHSRLNLPGPHKGIYDKILYSLCVAFLYNYYAVWDTHGGIHDKIMYLICVLYLYNYYTV